MQVAVHGRGGYFCCFWTSVSVNPQPHGRAECECGPVDVMLMTGIPQNGHGGDELSSESGKPAVGRHRRAST
ncbi:hypothetical protein C479_10470 [Halovivax asiaticus JCM 14624]|uniref:Uncharacterized protein n=1 Tax=Halovivax asiaticus JCM 14624 TaxID=1227490 RepID=M0BG10_9EURY|nr:hypothetical protein [Halovivax asiaticus]ELZ09238.1 hypothetical protein C479_10470 [Halovivax asiaticus JCM 14624]